MRQLFQEHLHGSTGERGDVLQRSSLGSSGGDNDAVLHGVVLFQSLDELGDSGPLLTNCHVDTVQLLGLVIAVVPSLLVQHGIESDCSLSGLAIADDKFTLTTTNWHHGVDGLKTSLDWLVDRSSGKDTRGLQLGTSSLASLDWALAINWVTEGVNDTTKQGLADSHVDLVSLAARTSSG